MFEASLSLARREASTIAVARMKRAGLSQIRLSYFTHVEGEGDG